MLKEIVMIIFPDTVGIQKPDMSGFRMVDHVRISNGDEFQMAAILSNTIWKPD